jgi:hypothetical protein
MVTFPLALAADWGANATLKLALWPAVRVSGVVIPLRLNPVPLIPTWEIVRVEPPELVTVSDRDWLLPTVTLPKFRLVGFDPSVPWATPVPDNGMVRVGLDALEVMARLPVTLPPAAGENFVLKLTLWPAAKLVGKVKPLTLNPEPVVLAAEIATLVPPELVRVTVRDALVPVVTLPKPRLAGAEVS